MSAIHVVRWTVRLTESVLEALCPRCDIVRPHPFSGRARLNANGKYLDAWLLFTCAHCSRTRKVALLERVHVRTVDPALLDALHANDPDVLGPVAARAVGGDAFAVDGPPLPEGGIVVLDVDAGVRVRLDRVLARGLGCSRAEVVRRCATAPLRKRARSGLRVRVDPPVAGVREPEDALESRG